MEIEQIKPHKPSFGMVVALSAAAIIVVFIAAIIILKIRDKKKGNPPFVKHPVSEIYTAPPRSLAV